MPPFLKLAIGGTVATAFAAVLLWRLDHVSDVRRAAAEMPRPPIPVTATIVTAQNVPQYLQGLGTVQAYNTVAIKSRVDGQIFKVFYKQGDEVKAGASLIEIDPRPYQAALDAALAQKEKDEAQLQTAKADLARYGKLVVRGFQSAQQYDQQKGLVKQLEAAIKGDAAQIETARLNLGYTLIRAPISGRLGARLVDVGNFVRAADNVTLVTINEVRPIFVSFTLPQKDLYAVRQSEKDAPLPVIAISGEGTSALGRGQLTFIDNAIDQSTGTIAFKARFANDAERLWPGEFVNVKVILRVLKDVPTVPSPTVEEGPDGHYVYVIRKNDTVERRPVRVGESGDGVTVVTKGLKPGERVVVEGQYRLVTGARVAPRPFEKERAAAAAGTSS